MNDVPLLLRLMPLAVRALSRVAEIHLGAIGEVCGGCYWCRDTRPW